MFSEFTNIFAQHFQNPQLLRENPHLKIFNPQFLTNHGFNEKNQTFGESFSIPKLNQIEKRRKYATWKQKMKIT